jgi:hypothetical protein
MEGKTLVRSAIMVLCVAVTTLGLRNSHGDNSESLRLAERTACAKEGCSFSLLRESRSAFSHEYSFQTRLVQKGAAAESASADVECKREAVLLGEWRCALKGAAP